MKSELIDINGAQYIKVKLYAIDQKSNRFFVGVIPANLLLKVYTVKPYHYNSEKEAAVANAFKDDVDYFQFRIETKAERAEGEDFERPYKEERIEQIADFLNNDDYALFPNSIITTCYLTNEELGLPNNTKFGEFSANNVLGLPFLEETTSPDEAILYVPYKENMLLLIDGQHRLLGLKDSNDEVRNNYELLVSFMLGFPQATIAELFYTINYNQKPVNKSLLYDLMGEFSKELDEITFMHEVVRVMNEIPKSPLHRRVKMLGVVEEGLDTEIKDKMTISQAFIIDYLIDTISQKAYNKTLYPPIFLHYYQDESWHSEIVRFVVNYLTGIKEVNVEAWDNPEKSIISSSLGIGALIQVMFLVFMQMFVDEFNYDPKKIKNITVETMKTKLSGLRNVDFDKAKWAGISSGGALSNLVKEILVALPFLGITDYKNDIQQYKTKYVIPFKKWLSSNCDLSKLKK